MIRATVKFNKQVIAKLQQSEIQAIQDGCEYILQEANKLVPLDEGTLQRSGNTSIDSSKKTGSIYYDTKYTIRLHENPQYTFQKGRQGKWLETTIRANKRVLDIIRKKLQEGFR